jgi:hypothetical protein
MKYPQHTISSEIGDPANHEVKVVVLGIFYLDLIAEKKTESNQNLVLKIECTESILIVPASNFHVLYDKIRFCETFLLVAC